MISNLCLECSNQCLLQNKIDFQMKQMKRDHFVLSQILPNSVLVTHWSLKEMFNISMKFYMVIKQQILLTKQF